MCVDGRCGHFTPKASGRGLIGLAERLAAGGLEKLLRELGEDDPRAQRFSEQSRRLGEAMARQGFLLERATARLATQPPSEALLAAVDADAELRRKLQLTLLALVTEEEPARRLALLDQVLSATEDALVNVPRFEAAVTEWLAQTEAEPAGAVA